MARNNNYGPVTTRHRQYRGFQSKSGLVCRKWQRQIQIGAKHTVPAFHRISRPTNLQVHQPASTTSEHLLNLRPTNTGLQLQAQEHPATRIGTRCSENELKRAREYLPEQLFFTTFRKRQLRSTTARRSEDDREASAVSGATSWERLRIGLKPLRFLIPHAPGLHGGEFSPIPKSDIVSTPAMTARDNGPCTGGQDGRATADNILYPLSLHAAGLVAPAFR